MANYIVLCSFVLSFVLHVLNPESSHLYLEVYYQLPPLPTPLVSTLNISNIEIYSTEDLLLAFLLNYMNFIRQKYGKYNQLSIDFKF